MIRKAKEYNNKFKNAKFVVNDGKSLNVLDSDYFDLDYFDLAYSELAFQHMLRPIQESHVREILRVLKKEWIILCANSKNRVL